MRTLAETPPLKSLSEPFPLPAAESLDIHPTGVEMP